jgi:hypothetical protein
MKPLPFENADFAAMARNINDPGKPAPLPAERSTLAHDILDVAKTGIETYGAVKVKQIDAKRQSEINTINAMTSAYKLAGLGMTVPAGMGGLTQGQADEVNRAAEAQRLREKTQKPPAPDREYTNVTLVKNPVGQKPGWYNVRNVFNRETKQSANYYTAYDGVPAVAMQRDAMIQKEVDELTPLEKERLTWLKSQKDKLFKDKDTGTYREVDWQTWLSKQKKSKKIEDILMVDEQPIVVGGGPTAKSWYESQQ